MKKEQFRALRIKLGLTQKRLGSLLGFKEQTIYFIESGRRPVEARAEKGIQTLNYIFNKKLFVDYLDNIT